MQQSENDKLYLQLLSIIGINKLTPSSIVIITAQLMQIISTITTMSGIQKKELVISVLNRFIIEKMGDNEESQAVKTIIYATLPTIIDTYVSIDKKELIIKIKSCWCCFNK